MPYIRMQEREILDRGMVKATNPGHLNYQITKLCNDFLAKTRNYSDYNTIIGVLECCKLEFYRRAVAPYEDQKMNENGEVYRT